MKKFLSDHFLSDIDSLFTNISVEETIEICTKNLFSCFGKSEFKDLQSLATKESFFIFNNILYKQTDRVAMGSPLGPSLDAFEIQTIVLLTVC